MTEQISLFEELYKSEQQYFADRICDEINALDTVWKGTFYVSDVVLNRWDHVGQDYKTLEITIKSTKNDEENRFTYLKGDRQSQINLMTAGSGSKWIGGLMKDKDFDMSLTPWCIYIFYHRFERKKIKYDC